jgi:glycosyltransferase involved in cell wall biosynthesis
VVASLAQHGAAAPRSRRPYGCWVGTTIAGEWAGRAAGLSRPRRLAAGASVPVLERLERRVLRGAAALYATSAASRAEIAAATGRDDVGLLPIPIDAERFKPAPEAAWREALAEPVLVFVGRADDPRKNLPLLLEAFARLRPSLPSARLLLVGEPPAACAPAGVEVVGRVADVAAELRRAALFVLPSRQEGFCIAAAEALACGLPVVSTPCGGPEDVLRSSGGGVVVEGFGADELARTIEEVATDPVRAEAMRTGGRSYVERVHAPQRFRELVGDALMQLG